MDEYLAFPDQLAGYSQSKQQFDGQAPKRHACQGKTAL